MAYVALYRKWRPQDFASVVGQAHIVRTLTGAIERNQVAHAYLFSGPRGTGKTSMAKILAKSLNCTAGPTIAPCGVCECCRKITEGTSMDVLEIDAASNRGIDEIRSLRETVGFLPVDGRYKVYIIDEVHMLTTEAFNALLKTLEEPPPHILFILATTEPHKIPATIHSRCQRYDFHRIGADAIETRLAEIVDKSRLAIAPEALRLIASAADGGMRDALSILDQCLTISADTVTEHDVEDMLGMVGHTWVEKLADTVLSKDARQTLLVFAELMASGKEPRQMLTELAEHLRAVLVAQVAPEAAGTTSDRAVLLRQANVAEAEDLSRMIRRLYEAVRDGKYTSDSRIGAEVALLDLCARQYGDSEIDKLTARIADLEDRLARGAVGNPQTPLQQPSASFGATCAVEANVVKERTERAAPMAKKPVSSEPIVTTYRAPLPQPTQTMVRAKQTPAAERADKETYGAIWQSVLDALVADNKRSAYACVSQGRLTEVKEHTVTVAFERTFVKERTEKDDYRTMLEAIFARILGRTVRMNCVQQAAPKKNEPSPHDKYPHAVREAIKMFGDNITVTDE